VKVTKSISFVLRPLLGALLIGLSSLATALAGETDPSRIVQPPSMPLPAAGTSFTDPIFGTSIKRIANPADFGSNELRPEYSQLQAWNADGSLLLVNAGLILETKGYTLAHKIDYGWPASGQALRWSPVDPNKLYYIGGDFGGCGKAGLYEYRLTPGNPMAGTPVLVKCFPEYQRLLKDQSWEEMSEDGRIIALVGTKAADNKWGYVAEVFAFDVVSGTKYRPLELPVDPTWGPVVGDRAAASPSGKYVLVQFSGGTGRMRGLEAFDLNMNYLGKVHTGNGHGDLARDASGNEWAIVDNSNNSYLFTGNHYIVKARIPQGVAFDTAGNVDPVATEKAGLTVRLLQVDWFLHMHISCRNIRAPGWCVFGTYYTKEGFDNGWQPFESEVVKLNLDSTHTAPKVERLAHHRSTYAGISPRDPCTSTNYWAQPHATVRPDGGELIFGSNWGQICDPSEPVDAFVADLRANAVVRPKPPSDVVAR
jgi:hypothetical protein